MEQLWWVQVVWALVGILGTILGSLGTGLWAYLINRNSLAAARANLERQLEHQRDELGREMVRSFREKQATRLATIASSKVAEIWKYDREHFHRLATKRPDVFGDEKLTLSVFRVPHAQVIHIMQELTEALEDWVQAIDERDEGKCVDEGLIPGLAALAATRQARLHQVLEQYIKEGPTAPRGLDSHQGIPATRT